MMLNSFIINVFRSFVIMGFELLLHDQFGSLDYWNVSE